LAYKVEVPSKVAKTLKKLPKKDAQAIVATLESLENDPRPPAAIRLTNRDEWRVRVGNYRIVYLIEDERLVVVVVRVGHRKDIYR
jgi:mRNA interferase RelE/StbE